MDLNFENLKDTFKTQMFRNEMAANNLANINSIGFKRDVMFSKVLESRSGTINIVENRTDFSCGSIEQTDNPFDLAISGPGFFVLEGNDGDLYTRNGHFTVGEDGLLRSQNGLAVLSTNGWIQLSDGQKLYENITISNNGEIHADDLYLGQIQIVDFESYNALRKQGDNVFCLNTDSRQMPIPVEKPLLAQGKLEQSNVNAVEEMVNLIEIQRKFESTQRALQAIDKALDDTVNKLGVTR